MLKGKKNLGDRGEKLACAYLVERGHNIVERNWRVGHLEIDIISTSSEGLHFTEVKSRTAPYLVRPQENVNKKKQERIVKAAQRYLNVKRNIYLGKDMEVFFDIIAIIFKEGTMELEYFPKAYMPIFV